MIHQPQRQTYARKNIN